ncbi:MAG TPA: hypothetical protein VLB46_02010 [Pyrinomonadaceae bacterium]|nr:hypothetical protein [Pyrinomonadaceae bacterium]
MADVIDLESSLDEHVAISGLAVNAKAGAIVTTDREEVIYLTDMHRWPKEFLDQRVVVEGTLRRGQVYPEAKDEEKGWSQGMSGDEQWYLEVDSYRLA